MRTSLVARNAGPISNRTSIVIEEYAENLPDARPRNPKLQFSSAADIIPAFMEFRVIVWFVKVLSQRLTVWFAVNNVIRLQNQWPKEVCVLGPGLNQWLKGEKKSFQRDCTLRTSWQVTTCPKIFQKPIVFSNCSRPYHKSFQQRTRTPYSSKIREYFITISSVWKGEASPS